MMRNSRCWFLNETWNLPKHASRPHNPSMPSWQTFKRMLSIEFISHECDNNENSPEIDHSHPTALDWNSSCVKIHPRIVLLNEKAMCVHWDMNTKFGLVFSYHYNANQLQFKDSILLDLVWWNQQPIQWNTILPNAVLFIQLSILKLHALQAFTIIIMANTKDPPAG